MFAKDLTENISKFTWESKFIITIFMGAYPIWYLNTNRRNLRGRGSSVTSYVDKNYKKQWKFVAGIAIPFLIEILWKATKF